MKMRKSAPLLGAFGLLAVVGAANATPTTVEGTPGAASRPVG